MFRTNATTLEKKKRCNFRKCNIFLFLDQVGEPEIDRGHWRGGSYSCYPDHCLGRPVCSFLMRCLKTFKSKSKAKMPKTNSVPSKENKTRALLLPLLYVCNHKGGTLNNIFVLNE